MHLISKQTETIMHLYKMWSPHFSKSTKIITSRCFLFPTAMVAMVKANAYGHGAVPIALHLKSIGVERLGVATIEEGFQLRQADIKGPIHVFGEQFLHHHNIIKTIRNSPICVRSMKEPGGLVSWTWCNLGGGRGEGKYGIWSNPFILVYYRCGWTLLDGWLWLNVAVVAMETIPRCVC